MNKYKQYREYLTRDSPKEERSKYGVGDIWKNTIKCTICNDEITSNHRHDFKWCSCHGCAIDGGSWYHRITGDSHISKLEMFNDYVG